MRQYEDFDGILMLMVIHVFLLVLEYNYCYLSSVKTF